MAGDKTDSLWSDTRPQLTFLYLSIVFLLGALVIVKSASLFFLASNPQLIYSVTDWPDTAAMAEMVEHGQLFSPDSHFIAGGQIFGLFPPLFPILIALLNVITKSTILSFFIISVPLQIVITYLVVRDWPDGWQVLILVLLLNFNDFSHFFPIVTRLRELLAVFFLVVLYKNPFKMRTDMLYAIFGALMVLTQPMVALLGILSYPVIQAEWKPAKLKRSHLLTLVLLGLLFLLVYHQQFLLKAAFSGGVNSVRCIQTIPLFSSSPWFLLFTFLVPSIFFFFFLPSGPIRRLWWAYLGINLFALLLQYSPDLFLTILRPFKEDLCFGIPFLPICFFALFPPHSKPGGRSLPLLAGLLLIQLLFSILTLPVYSPFEKTDVQMALEHITPGSTILPIELFLWEAPQRMLFVGFGYPVSSEVFMRDAPVKTYYSPMQQYYDTERVMPETMALMESIGAQNRSACISNAQNLSARADYLFVQSSATSFANTSWSKLQMDRWGNATWLAGCGLTLAYNDSGTSTLLYNLGKNK